MSLEARRVTEDVLAEAVEARRDATAQATEITRVAEALAAQIVADAYERAAHITETAHGGVEQRVVRERLNVAIDRLEAMASDVQLILDSALAEVTAALTGLVPRD